MERRKSFPVSPIEHNIEDIEQPGQIYSPDSRKKNSHFCRYTVLVGILILAGLLFFFGDKSTLNRFGSSYGSEMPSIGIDLDTSQNDLQPLVSTNRKADLVLPSSSTYSLSKLNLIRELNRKCQVQQHFII